MRNSVLKYEADPPEKGIRTVAELTREIKLSLESGFPSLWVEGEISNFTRHSSGHFYFSLKDKEAQIACVMWRGRNKNLLFRLQDGMRVFVYADLTVYERQGKYQLDIFRIRPAGIGDLQMAFEALKRQLDEEGLFDPDHKKPLPDFPETIGIVTSPTGAALRDILSVIRRRFPSVKLVLRPVRVQGEFAAKEIAEAIDEFNAFGKVDVLIAGRGGGSLEDLWAFNEEVVARAIYRSEIPIISAVGHEIDFCISDFVADFRAPTPSAAAEQVVMDRTDLNNTLQYWGNQIYRSVHNRILQQRDRILGLIRSYGFRWPLDRIRELRMRIDESNRILETTFYHRLEKVRNHLNRMHEKLTVLNPQSVLERGYSITTRIRDNYTVRNAEEVEKEEVVRIQFARGTVRSKIEEIES